jgi:hypothetical protein
MDELGSTERAIPVGLKVEIVFGGTEEVAGKFVNFAGIAIQRSDFGTKTREPFFDVFGFEKFEEFLLVD